MGDANAKGAKGRRVFRIVIKAPIEAVWREITRTDAPIACFFNSRMCLSPAGLAPGSRLAMRTPDGRNTGVVGTILAVEPPSKFSHTFRFTSERDPECVVTYELRTVPEGTEFTLVIDDLPEGTRTAKQMVQGGSLIINTLRAVMERGRPTLGVRALFMLLKFMPAPKACRSEHWPV